MLETLRDHLEGGYSVWVTCTACHHDVKIDLAAILARFGDMSWPAFRRRLRCSACGARRVHTTRTPPYQWNNPDRCR